MRYYIIFSIFLFGTILKGQLIVQPLNYNNNYVQELLNVNIINNSGKVVQGVLNVRVFNSQANYY